MIVGEHQPKTLNSQSMSGMSFLFVSALTGENEIVGRNETNEAFHSTSRTFTNSFDVISHEVLSTMGVKEYILGWLIHLTSIFAAQNLQVQRTPATEFGAL